MDKLSRWPLLLATVLMLGGALTLDLTTNGYAAIPLITLGAAALGAFLYAEGARHRDWLNRDRDTPGAGPDPDP